MSQSVSDFVWVKISGVHVYNCYVLSNGTLSKSEDKLDNFVHDGRGRNSKVILMHGAWNEIAGKITQRTKTN